MEEETIKQKIPNPGTQEAQDLGCACPILDNEYGNGYMGQKGVFVYNDTCKVHAEGLKEIREAYEREQEKIAIISAEEGAEVTPTERKARKLSGCFFRHKDPSTKKMVNVCFEDLPVEEQKACIAKMENGFKENLIMRLAEVLRELGDKFDIYN